MKFEQALQYLEKSKIIREMNSGNEYSLINIGNNQIEVATTTLSKNTKDLVLSFKFHETITWKEILYGDWEIL